MDKYYIKPEYMSEFLVKKILLSEVSYFRQSDLLAAAHFLVKFNLRFLHVRMKEKPIVLPKVRSLCYFYWLVISHVEFSFHISDKFHEERTVLSFLFFL